MKGSSPPYVGRTGSAPLDLLRTTLKACQECECRLLGPTYVELQSHRQGCPALSQMERQSCDACANGIQMIHRTEGNYDMTCKSVTSHEIKGAWLAVSGEAGQPRSTDQRRPKSTQSGVGCASRYDMRRRNTNRGFRSTAKLEERRVKRSLKRNLARNAARGNRKHRQCTRPTAPDGAQEPCKGAPKESNHSRTQKDSIWPIHKVWYFEHTRDEIVR